MPPVSQPTSSPNYSLAESPQPKGNAGGGASYAYNYYIKKGLSPAHAAGIVGNLGVESANWDPNVISGNRRGDQGTAGYIGQWRGPRLRGLEEYARSQGHSAPTLDDQLEYVLQEGQTGRDQGAATAYKLAQAAKTPEEAAAIYSKYYERPGTPFLERRQSLARQAAGSQFDPNWSPPQNLSGAGSPEGPNLVTPAVAPQPVVGADPVSQVFAAYGQPQQPQQVAGLPQAPAVQTPQVNPMDHIIQKIEKERSTASLKAMDRRTQLAYFMRLGQQHREKATA
jgi:hypothetical protein